MQPALYYIYIDKVKTMKKKFLQGKKTIRVGTIISSITCKKNYCFHFYNDGIKIAMIYYHHAAKQLIINPCEVCLTKTTIISLLPYLNIKFFRLQRRLIMSHIRRLKNKTNIFIVPEQKENENENEND